MHCFSSSVHVLVPVRCIASIYNNNNLYQKTGTLIAKIMHSTVHTLTRAYEYAENWNCDSMRAYMIACMHIEPNHISYTAKHTHAAQSTCDALDKTLDTLSSIVFWNWFDK